jgi:ribose transport system permease protein
VTTQSADTGQVVINDAAPGQLQPPRRAGSLERLAGAWVGIALATIALFVFCWVFERSSVSHDALIGMLPFAAVLAIAAAGQTLVIQQSGIDLSVAGMISLAVVIMTRYPNGDSSKVTAAIFLAVAATLVAGAVSGFLVSRVGITPIVTTLGMNAILVGAVLKISGGRPRQTTDRLENFMGRDVLGVPITVVVAVVVTAVVALIVKRTVAGRRFEAVGASAISASAAGLRVQRHRMSAYVAAAGLYCVAGILLAGVVNTPSASQGDKILLPSIAAVVLGGTSLLGGRGSVVASAIAALFLSQLDQLVLATGASSAVQYLVQAGALVVGLAIYSVPWRQMRGSKRPAAQPAVAVPPT